VIAAHLPHDPRFAPNGQYAGTARPTLRNDRRHLHDSDAEHYKAIAAHLPHDPRFARAGIKYRCGNIKI